MNDDLISRKELYAAIAELADNADCNIAILPEVASLVRHAPAIDAEPKRGCWIENDCAYNRCSECGYEYDHPEEKSPYCPNCGANMDLEDEK